MVANEALIFLASTPSALNPLLLRFFLIFFYVVLPFKAESFTFYEIIN